MPLSCFSQIYRFAGKPEEVAGALKRENVVLKGKGVNGEGSMRGVNEEGMSMGGGSK